MSEQHDSKEFSPSDFRRMVESGGWEYEGARTGKELEFEHLLDSAKGEHEIHSFLRQHPKLLAKIFIPVDRNGYVLNKPKVSMGGKYEPDFILLESMSGAWIVHFIELEPVNEPLFSSTGHSGQRLKGAIKQIEDWKGYISNAVNELLFRQEISEVAKHKDLLNPCWIPRHVMCSAGCALSDPQTTMFAEWHIIIGRRDEQSEEAISRKARMKEDRDINIRTYDCFFGLNWADIGE